MTVRQDFPAYAKLLLQLGLDERLEVRTLSFDEGFVDQHDDISCRVVAGRQGLSYSRCHRGYRFAAEANVGDFARDKLVIRIS